MTTQDWSVSGGLPPEIAIEQQQLRRRQSMADALMEQAMRPIQGNQMAGGYVVPISPFQGLAQMANTYVAGKKQREAEEGMKGLGARYQQGLADAVQQYGRAKAGTPGSEETIIDEQANDGEGAQATIAAPAVAGDSRKAIREAMLSQYPQMRQMAQLDLSQLNRQEDRADTQRFRAQEAQAAREARMSELQMRMQDARATAADRAAMQRELAQMQIDARRDIASMNAGLRRDLAGQNQGGKAPPGYRFKPDGSMEAIPGGPADTKQQGAFNADTNALQGATSNFDRLATAVNQLKASPGLKGITGIRGAIPNVPGTAAADAQAQLETLKSQVAFGVLQDMRNQSKTGGALGAVSEKELMLLQNNLQALDKAQSYEQMVKSLEGILKYTEEAKDRLRGAYNMRHSGKAPAKAPGASGGWGIQRVE